jgi:N-acetylglucosaminyl-diphospho-decaprenol L-rhamnosyltransferase
VNLSVVIVNWNSGFHLARLLESLRPVRSEVARIIVVDNASSDGSRAVAERSFGVEVIGCASNRGFAGGANLGIGASKDPYILLLNPDVRVEGDSLRGLYREIEASSDAALVCGRLLGEGGESQTAFQIRALPSLGGVLRDALFLDELVDLWRGGVSVPEPEAGTVEQPAAACWLLRRTAWEELGGFDERFHPAWFEDVDFCRRLRDGGWRVLYFPQWTMTHRGGISLDSLGYGEFLRVYYGNLLRYWRKHHPASLPLVWPAVRLGQMLRRAAGRR